MKKFNKNLIIISIILFILLLLIFFYKLMYCDCGIVYNDDVLNLCAKEFSFLLYIPIVIFLIASIVNIIIKHDKKIKSILLWFTGTTLWFFIIRSVVMLEELMTNSIDKPLIYIYPKKKTDVTVKLCNEDMLTCTYPKYEKEWKIIAYPNGNLLDKKTNKNFYGLYWEGKNNNKIKITDGFCIKGTDTSTFLEEKLSILGLNERETNEFIMYWLPRLEKNNFNLIRFKTMEEINEMMPLDINPKPDTIIRVMMEYIPLIKYKKIPEQQLTSVTRSGYTVVEWGGIISSKKRSLSNSGYNLKKFE